MNLTNDKLIKVISKDNQKLLSFTLSFLSQKQIIINTIITELDISKNELEEFSKILIDLEILKKQDLKLIKIKTKVKKEESAKEIIEHLKITTKKKRLELNVKRETRINNLLLKYTKEDFEKVNIYFTKDWGSKSKMKKYLTPDTLYNEKFPLRVEEAQNYFEELETFKEELYRLCQNYYKLIQQEMPKENDICNNMPIDIHNALVHWLSNGYNMDQIERTLNATILQWSKKQELKNYISLSKILDNKFPQRERVAKKINNLKPGVSAINEWLKAKEAS
jgi:uncharacterized phage protein (TIGR02220 family)